MEIKEFEVVKLFKSVEAKKQTTKKGEERMKKLLGFFKEEEGATAVEYALLVSLIAGVIILAVTGLGTKLTNVFTGVDNKIPVPAN